MYDDGTVSVDENGITIQRYGLLARRKRIPHADILSVHAFDLGHDGRWRLAGIGFSRNWYNWDPSRHGKSLAFSIDTGSFVRPTVTPDDPDTFSSAMAAGAQAHQS